ncbi:MAG: FtsQ-type POTRA domain-containing protein [Spirochaetaceae bacterium]|jgi:cell division protein FtsQ|nr:FtsQ-type POTRA domain-containing protein [Spirochaetaceae bacterium]
MPSDFVYTGEKMGRERNRRRGAPPKIQNPGHFQRGGRNSGAGESPGRNSTKVDKWLVRLVILIAGILAAELLWLFGITPLLPLSVVEVDTVSGIDRASLLARAGIGSHSSYFTVNTMLAEKNLEQMYQIESARVIKQYPDTVRVFVEQRRPAALSLVNRGGRVIPVYIDKHGMLIQIGDSPVNTGSSTALPIVSGLTFERLEEGAKLPAELEGFFSRLDLLNENAPELLAFISEIGINKKAYNGFDLVLYPVNSAIKFRLEPDLNEDALRYMILMMDVFDSTGVRVDEVDLRNGTASYIVKEAQSG